MNNRIFRNYSRSRILENQESQETEVCTLVKGGTFGVNVIGRFGYIPEFKNSSVDEDTRRKMIQLGLQCGLESYACTGRSPSRIKVFMDDQFNYRIAVFDKKPKLLKSKI